MARNMIDRAKAARIGKAPIAETIAGLETTKAQLETRIPVLEATKATALERRREALISDPAGSAASEAAQAARAAEDNLAAVADALSEVERRLAEARDQREADQARAARESVAAALESDATKIADATQAMKSAIEAVAKAHARMMLAVSPTAAPQLVDTREQLSPKDFADGVLLQAIVAALPGTAISAEIFPGDWTRPGPVEARQAAETGTDAADRLRDVAARVRSGAVGGLPEWQDRSLKVYARPPRDVPVYPTACFSFLDHDGRVRRITPLESSAPEPVVEAAIRAGVADRSLGVTSQRARQLWERKREITPSENLMDDADVIDLGVDLQEAARAEEDRQRAEWQAAQDAYRAELERRAA